MEEDVIIQNEESEKAYGCRNCSSPIIEEGYEAELCKDCREKFAKRPLPIWVKGFFILILSIVIIALSKFPKSISSGVAFEKGLKAEMETRYITASKEYEKAAKEYPDSVLVQARLFIAYAKSGKIREADNTYKLIEGRDVSDRELLNDVTSTMDELDAQYAYSTELSEIVKKGENENSEITLKKLVEYCQRKPDDLLGLTYLGNIYFDMDRYQEAKEVYLKISEINPNLDISRLTLASVYRQTGEFDKAIEECNKVLKKNIESVSAYAAMARIELKRHNYKKALEIAEKAYNLNKEDLDAINTLTIAFHYNKMIKERDDLFNNLKQKNYYNLDVTKAIFDGKNNLFK